MSSVLKRLIYHSKYALSNTTKQSNKKSIVIALGGNAIKKPTDTGTGDEMFENVNNAASRILSIIKADPTTDYNLCITHGNGPQVGSLFLQNQSCSDTIPA
eukprot:982467_1